MNENVEGCNTIFSYNTFLDCNYGKRNCLNCLNRQK